MIWGNFYAVSEAMVYHITQIIEENVKHVILECRAHTGGTDCGLSAVATGEYCKTYHVFGNNRGKTHDDDSNRSEESDTLRKEMRNSNISKQVGTDAISRLYTVQ